MLEPALLASFVVVLVVVHGMLSAAELTVLAARPGRLDTLAAGGCRRARRLQRLRSDPEAFLAAVQTGEALSLGLAGILTGCLAFRHLGPRLAQGLGVPAAAGRAGGAVLATLALGYLWLLLGTAIPRALARRHAERVALLVSTPLAVAVPVLGPAVAAVSVSSRAILRVFGMREARRTFVSEQAVRALLPDGPETGVLDRRGAELPEAVARFVETPVRQLMVPRAKMFAMDLRTPPQDVARLMGESGFSRIPVYDGGIDDVVGLVYIKDVLRRLERSLPLNLARLLHAVHFVPETKQAGELLRELRRRRRHMAVVIDEHGSVTGLVTLEDLIEEIVGEIQDEYDLDEHPVERLRDGSLVAEGTVSAEELREEYGLPIPESDEFETVAGFVLARLGAMPHGGETTVVGEFRFTVLEVERHRISRVKVERVTSPVEAR